MKTLRYRFLLPFLLGTVAFAIAGGPALRAQGDCDIVVAAISGEGKTHHGSLSVGSKLVQEDTIWLGKDAALDLKIGGAVARFSPGSTIAIDVAFCENPSTKAVRLKLISGRVWAKGDASLPKYEIATSQAMAIVGTNTVEVEARYLDTTFILEKDKEVVEVMGIKDTVGVVAHHRPFKGDKVVIRTLQGNVMVMPWGSRGVMVKQGEQTIWGIPQDIVSSKATPTVADHRFFSDEGNYR